MNDWIEFHFTGAIGFVGNFRFQAPQEAISIAIKIRDFWKLKVGNMRALIIGPRYGVYRGHF